jgi:preprotein translocase subunit YajC
MLFSTAFAQTAAGGGSDFQAQLVQFAPLIMIAAVFYFLLIRPQQQRQKQLKTALAALRRGDKIITAGGIIASVARVINDEEVEAEIATGVKVRLLRSTITTILSKPEPAGKDAGKSKDKAEKDVTTTVIEGEIEEIDATAEGSGSARRKRAAAKVAKPAETKPAETVSAETAEPKSTDEPK